MLQTAKWIEDSADINKLNSNTISSIYRMKNNYDQIIITYTYYKVSAWPVSIVIDRTHSPFVLICLELALTDTDIIIMYKKVTQIK